MLHAFGKKRQMNVRFVGRKMVYPILSAVALGLSEGRDLEEVCQALEKLAPTRSRLHPVQLKNGAVLLCDDFKSPPSSLEAALELLEEIPDKCKWVLLGGLSNLPSKDVKLHYFQAGEKVAKGADRILLIGDRSPLYFPGFEKGGFPVHNTLQFSSVADVTAYLQKELTANDVVLIKGFEDQGLRRIPLALQGKKVGCKLTICKIPQLCCDQCPMLAGP